MLQYEAILKPLKIKNLVLRNRIFSTSHADKLPIDGVPVERQQRYHEEKAKGGIALSMFGGSSSVSLDSPAERMNAVALHSDSIIPELQNFSDRLHRLGTAIMIQITHMGRKNRYDTGAYIVPPAPSPIRDAVVRSVAREIDEFDMKRIITDFGEAAKRCEAGHLDGVELMASANHLIDQFWSPTANKRTDRYGGSLENRMRFGLQVLEHVRKVVGSNFLIGMRISGDEMIENGLTGDDCIKIAQTYAGTGMLDFMNVTAGHRVNAIGYSTYLPNMYFPSAPYLYLASAIKAELDIPVFHANKIADLATANRAVAEGHIDMVGMTRAHIADPYLLKKALENRADDIRPCVGAMYCLSGRGAQCIHNAAAGRETILPHVISKSDTRRRIVVVGGGPAGLEAARVSAERGHAVTLFEAQDKLGGQLNIASRVSWRESLSNITRWLEGQVKRLDVDIRLGKAATADDIATLAPDVVIMATGGLPNLDDIEGLELAHTTWDILGERVPLGKNVLIWDLMGQEAGISCAEFAAERGSVVEMVTYDRAPAEEVYRNNQTIFLRETYKAGVIFTPNLELKKIYAEGNSLIAVFRNTFTEEDEERQIDQIVVERGVVPNLGIYHELKSESRNLGEIDIAALTAGRPQQIVNNPDGQYNIFTVGDATGGRDIHSAIYDSLRLCNSL
ncbi:FAD-dependent oxidoreductase [Bradyrhizobium sp. BWA-3-5]|uniref:oxidoreductase n=1 Tax=Bradyrhizobium sp. BWA-3-5 TaxID=3080013 RepID=UPI00293E6CFE|nr:FAD-dependent oxidoreductase [Bradyrhizobium sp. BWA-3-5]WOH63719.1 FAD-dependent oxidoreductase [Bradyrhizobium sp. BWA-3-5]